MLQLLQLLFRFLPPYKKYISFHIVCNLLHALFGIFSFLAMIPILGVLFGTQTKVYEKKDWNLEIETLKHNINYAITQVIDNYGSLFALFIIAFSLIILVFCKTFFQYLSALFIIPVRNGIIKDMRTQLYNKIIELPISFYSGERKGDIISRMTSDVQEVEGSIFNALQMFFLNPIIILFSLLTMLYMSWQLTLFVFTVMPVALIFIGRLSRKLRGSSQQAQEQRGLILSIIGETIEGLRIIKVFNSEKEMKGRFSSVNQQYVRLENRVLRRISLASPLSEFLGTCIISAALLYGGSLVLNQETDLAAQNFIGYLVIFYSIVNPLKALSAAAYSIQRGLAALERTDEILQHEIAIKSKRDALEITEFKDKIEYQNVIFRYEEKNVLKGISFTVEKGKMIALVGQSGGGKSTTVDLLPRLYEVNEGSIRIDGNDIRDLTTKSLRALMGNVNQVPILFNDSFFNNIAFGKREATEEEVIHAAKVAYAHDFIMNTPNGYHSIIGDGGVKLSGGQRQRLSIARAILRNPAILILDEATSALDTESERLVQQALSQLMKDRTSIVVAHRLSTIQMADEIIMLKNGEIVERGTHKELISNGTEYKKLHSMQEILSP